MVNVMRLLGKEVSGEASTSTATPPRRAYANRREAKSADRRCTMASRHQARERAVQVLFQYDIHGQAGPWLDDFWIQYPLADELRSLRNDWSRAPGPIERVGRTDQ